MLEIDQLKRLPIQFLVFLRATTVFQRVGLGSLAVALCLTGYASTLQFTHLDPIASAQDDRLDLSNTDEVKPSPTTRTKTATQSATPASSISDQVVIELSGAVVHPGVYTLEKTQRLSDALALAGGFAKNADKLYLSKNVNLAARVSDAMLVYIPAEGESSVTRLAGSTQAITLDGTTGSESSESVNVNTATLAQLETLKGIGAARAQAIIDHRPYQTADELKTNASIPASVMSDISSQLTF
ncbi:MAG TPA: ComEA family DNA-binding protein [Candidatus Saccharimonadia bacterium]|nr:ComEA family DNA-binding protein [Candidatus Saccharimonadia bacterium]